MWLIFRDKNNLVNIEVQFLAHGPNNYLFLMTMKHQVQFKGINKTFESCKENLNATKKSQETNVGDTSLEELEHFKSSYMLTISQAVPENNDANDTYVFEECSEVGLTMFYYKTVVKRWVLTVFLNGNNFKGSIFL